MKNILYLFLCFSLIISCSQNFQLVHQTDDLKIQQLTRNTFRHISYLQTDDYGLVACNGMIVIDNGEALIFDTPSTDSVSLKLIDHVEKKLKSKVKAIIVSHFHEDCLGGLNAFHEKGIPSYSSIKTIDLAKKNALILPENGFKEYLELRVGRKIVINEFLGEGHTSDNIIAYFPAEKVLFGGCLIKRIEAGKGFIGDANVEAWSKTVTAVEKKYGMAKVVIPGHGKPGGTGLLEYTIELFAID